MVPLKLQLARLVFVPARRDYELHRDLCRAFDSRREDAYLFRADLDHTAARSARQVVLVQSARPGNWSQLADRLASHETCERTWEIRSGGRYRFFLRANPTQAKKAGLHELADVRGEAFRKARGKRVALRGEGELVAWLGRQGERHGFRLVETAFPEEGGGKTDVPALRVVSGRDVEWRGNGKHGCHAGADFEGLLEVRDEGAFGRAVMEGIGPGKAFGFGLLSLGRIP